MTKIIITLPLILFLAACSNAGGYHMQPIISGMGQVIVYREDSILGTIMNSYWVEINGNEVCSLSNASYLVEDIAPGKVNIASSKFANFGTSRLSTNVKPGQTIYVKMEIKTSRMLGGAIVALIDEAASDSSGPVLLGQVNSTVALKEMSGFSNCQ